MRATVSFAIFAVILTGCAPIRSAAESCETRTKTFVAMVDCLDRNLTLLRSNPRHQGFKNRYLETARTLKKQVVAKEVSETAARRKLRNTYKEIDTQYRSGLSAPPLQTATTNRTARSSAGSYPDIFGSATAQQYAKNHDQRTCLSRIDKKPEVLTADQLFSKLRKINLKKDEFETTAGFAKRIESALVAVKLRPGELVFVRKPFDPKYIRYNADQRVLSYVKFGASNESVDCLDLTGFGQNNNNEICEPYFEKDFHLKTNTRETGRYIAANAFGRRANVSAIKHDQMGLIEGGRKSNSIWESSTRDGVIFRIKSTPAKARVLKNSTSLVIGFQIKHPYLVKGTKHFTAKITNPVDRTYALSYVVSDMQCAAITDNRSNKVIAKQALK